MNKITRRTLARYAAEQLQIGAPAGKLAKELAAIIIDSGQTIEPEFLLGDIAYELEQRQELAIGRVSSAHQLDSRVRETVKSQLKRATGAKEVLLEEKQDPNLIGGLRIETANRVWDYSLARELAQLKELF